MNKSIELYFNFHRRFLRGPINDDGNADNYLARFVKDDVTVDQLKNRPNLYSCQVTVESTQLSYSLEAIKFHSSAALSKTRFSEWFNNMNEAGELDFPYSILDFTVLDGFKNANGVTGFISLAFEKDHFILEGNFATLPPARFEEYKPSFEIRSTADLKKAIGRMSEVFAEAATLKE